MAEVAGLVLGAAPIIAATIKQYGTLYKVCKRYKKCHTGLDLLTETLEVQKAIFEMQTRLLLLPLFTADVTEAMLADIDHPMWQDTETNLLLENSLGSAKSALMTAAKVADERMKKMEDELSKINVPEKPISRSNIREWRRTVQSKIRYAVSEARLSSMVTSIREATTDYHTLRSQIQEARQMNPNSGRHTASGSEIKRIRTTQAAAERIYKILQRACSLHSQHQAHFGLKTSYNSFATQTEIRFQIAYQQPLLQPKSERNLMWFMVESIFYRSIPKALQASPQTNTTARQNQPNTALASFRISKSNIVPTATSSSVASTSTVTVASAPPTTSTSYDPPNLMTAEDFCAQLQNHCQGPGRAAACIGAVENSNEWKHRVYTTLGPSPEDGGQSYSVSSAKTLSALLTSHKTSSLALSGFSIVQRIQLAKILSTAVLNLYATPWMQSYWTSSDVFVYNFQPIGSSNTRNANPEAFIEVPVCRTSQPVDTRVSTNSMPASIRNPVIYNLGVILLELAFELPLQDMRDGFSDLSSHLTSSDFDLALQKCRTVSARMGKRYSDIVERCLWCDFGCGSDLSNVDLQEAIHLGVITEFEDMEAGFRRLGMV